MTFVLDTAGGEEVLKVLAAQAIVDLASQVMSKAGPGASMETSVTNERRGGGRFRARVNVPAEAQAKDGVLSKAAAEVGLTVTPFKKKPPKKQPSGEKTAPRKRGRPRKNSN